MRPLTARGLELLELAEGPRRAPEEEQTFDAPSDVEELERLLRDGNITYDELRVVPGEVWRVWRLTSRGRLAIRLARLRLDLSAFGGAR